MIKWSEEIFLEGRQSENLLTKLLIVFTQRYEMINDQLDLKESQKREIHISVTVSCPALTVHEDTFYVLDDVKIWRVYGSKTWVL